jgi:hypothetical protein
MKREFVSTKKFDAQWAAAGLTDNDRSALERLLLENPQAGDVIPGLSGGRKVRFALDRHGKSGGVRVIYVDVVVRERIYLLLAYPKSVQVDMTGEQKDLVNALIKAIKEEQ